MEAFPVGRGLAFDSWKGRLWAVCGRCRRWNLAPIETRWEAVEELERRFRDARVRVQSENVGLAKMADGTRLIRVGEAVPLELATWRYGDALRRGRRQILFGSMAGMVGGTVLMVAGAPLLSLGAVPIAVGGYALTQVAGTLLVLRGSLRPVVQVPASASQTGAPIVIRQQTSYHARLVPGEPGGGPAVELPSVLPLERVEGPGAVRWVAPPPLRLEGDLAKRFLERTLVTANVWSSGRGRLEAALARLDSPGGPEGLFRSMGERGVGLFPTWMMSNYPAPPTLRGSFSRLAGSFRGERIEGRRWGTPRAAPREEVLALEIALHEEAERRALQGELAALEEAWREAEEIAAIADRLPDDPLDSWPHRHSAE